MWSNQSDRKKICYIQEDHVNINIFINSIYDTHITFFSINELINRRGWGVAMWSWWYGIWIYTCLCIQCLSPLPLWVWIPLMAILGVLDTTLCLSVVFSGYSGFSTNKTDNHDITEILLKVVFNTIIPLDWFTIDGPIGAFKSDEIVNYFFYRKSTSCLSLIQLNDDQHLLSISLNLL